MSTYNTFDDAGKIALFDHIKTTRNMAVSNETAIGSLGEDLAALAEATVAELNGKQDTLTFDTIPTEGSSNPVTSEGVARYISDILGNIDTILDEINNGPASSVEMIDGILYIK